ncbi:hypothetical protein EC968_009971 [Mortierella alpina]|nr:hypothetical protein EC968_009971 [Mortierella alpina]
MSTVAKRLEAAQEQLLTLYTSIPVLTPCLEKIKTNQAEFVALNSSLRQLQETVTAGQQRADKARRQLDSVFTINKAECEKSYHHEISGLKAVEDERRKCLRRRDDVVTLKYRLDKDRVLLLDQTRKLKKLNDSVFDRSRDEVANTDFPEELYWQLELKEYDIKISALRQQVIKYKTALSNLARAANLSEAALMALLGYPDAAYKVWSVEYALKASQKMRLYLRVELSLTNAYSNEDAAREACPSIVPPLTAPVKPSTVQRHFESITMNSKRYKIQPFRAEHELRSYIAQLRAAHKSAELLLAQETERLQSMEAYRESIVPLLAKIRRHVFQNSCMAGLQIEGWEDDQGRSLLGTEADVLVRGGIHEIVPTMRGRSSHSSASPQTVPGSRRASDDFLDRDEENFHTAHSRERRSSARISDNDEQDLSGDSRSPVIVHDGQVVLGAGQAPLSIVSPANMLGSEVLMQVDRQRQAVLDNQSRRDIRRRSHSRSGIDSERGSGPDGQQGQDSNGSSALGSLMLNSGSADPSSGGQGQGEREGRKKISRGIFGFGRNRRGSHNDDAVVPASSASDTASSFQLPGRNSRSSVDVTSINTDGSSLPSSHASNGHRSNVPSISISREDEDGQTQHPLRRTFFENASMGQLPLSSSSTSSSSGHASPLSSPGSRARVMSMDEYVGVGPVAERDESYSRSLDLSQGSAPLIPSYAEHQMHQAIDPEAAFMMGLTSLAESDEGTASGMTDGLRIPDNSNSTGLDHQRSGYSHQGTRTRSRSLSPHPLFSFGAMAEDNYRRTNSNMTGAGTGTDTGTGAGMAPRASYQQHQYSFSDQTPDGSALSRVAPPPDYAMQPPQYTA